MHVCGDNIGLFWCTARKTRRALFLYIWNEIIWLCYEANIYLWYNERKWEFCKDEAAFKYPEIVHNHCQYCNAYDNHNAGCMDLIALEKTWKTIHWPNRVFAFLLVVSEINCWFILNKILSNKYLLQQIFWHLFAQELINNHYVDEENSTPKIFLWKKLCNLDHSLELLPNCLHKDTLHLAQM